MWALDIPGIIRAVAAIPIAVLAETAELAVVVVTIV
jgi:hypothetical protein